jgi:hypothetical protein
MKKKATKKKATKADLKVPYGRYLTWDGLRKSGACTPALLTFATVFGTFGRIVVTDETVDGLSDEQVSKMGARGAWNILSKEGQTKFYRSIRAQGLNDWGTDAVNVRPYLKTLAKYFLRYPKAGIGARVYGRG